MASSSTASFSRGHSSDMFPAGSTRTARILFQTGCAITLTYFPSGLLHAVLGSAVYLRDILMLIHLAACLIWLGLNGGAQTFLNRTWVLLVPALFILPAAGSSAYRVEAITFVKWTALWLDWIILGQIARTVLTGFELPVKIFLGVMVLLLLADAGLGLYESKSHTYVINEAGQVSAFGVKETKEMKLLNHLRVKGLQRDVFSYSNLMGMSIVLGFLVFVTEPSLNIKVTSIVWTLIFTVCLYESGGRSAFFGVFGAAAVTAGLASAPDGTRRHYGKIVAAWLAIALIISATGVGVLTESIGGSIMSGSDIGSSTSAYMRDTNWKGITESIKNLPVVLVSGAPLASLVDPYIDPIYHWADNEYLWLLYHTSILGISAVIFFFYRMLKTPAAEDTLWTKDCLVLFLLFVMGEAIARESMTFLGCMPLFIACGWQNGVESEERDQFGHFASGGASASRRHSSGRRAAFAERSSTVGKSLPGGRSPAPEQPAPAPAKGRSEAEQFARKIRQAAARDRNKE